VALLQHLGEILNLLILLEFHRHYFDIAFHRIVLAFNRSNPNIDKAVRLLQEYEATASDKYTNVKKATAKASYEEPEIQRREPNFKLVKSLLQTGGFELKVYLDQVVELHTFQPKKKYVEDLDDTDISDETEDDSDDEQATVITHQIDGMTI
jgi:hypothetical protein